MRFKTQEEHQNALDRYHQVMKHVTKGLPRGVKKTEASEDSQRERGAEYNQFRNDIITTQKLPTKKERAWRKKLDFPVSEGQRRLRIVISILTAVGIYIFLANNEYRLSEEEIFIIFPIRSTLGFGISYAIATCIFWVWAGFKGNNANNPDGLTIAKPEKPKDIEVLACSFIRNTAIKFDSFCRKNNMSRLYDSHGPFFAWSMLWLALNENRRPDAILKNITIKALKKVLKVDKELLDKAHDELLKANHGPDASSSSETARLLGLDMDAMFENAHTIFIERLEKAINPSLDKIKSDGKNKFVPILNVLMSRHSGSGAKNQFDQITDDEFERIFLEQCAVSFFKAQNISFTIIFEYNRQRLADPSF